MNTQHSMSNQHWLDTATDGLLPGIAARLQADYQEHIALSRGPEQKALADLGDPVQLNVQLRQQYPTFEDARDLRAIDQLKVSRRLPATGFGSYLQITGLTMFLMSLLIPLLHLLALRLSWATFDQPNIWLWFLPATLSLATWLLTLGLGRRQPRELQLMISQALDTLSALLLTPAVIVALYASPWISVLIATVAMSLFSLGKMRRAFLFMRKLWNAQMLKVRL